MHFKKKIFSEVFMNFVQSASYVSLYSKLAKTDMNIFFLDFVALIDKKLRKTLLGEMQF